MLFIPSVNIWFPPLGIFFVLNKSAFLIKRNTYIRSSFHSLFSFQASFSTVCFIWSFPRGSISQWSSICRVLYALYVHIHTKPKNFLAKLLCPPLRREWTYTTSHPICTYLILILCQCRFFFIFLIFHVFSIILVICNNGKNMSHNYCMN